MKNMKYLKNHLQNQTLKNNGKIGHDRQKFENCHFHHWKYSCDKNVDVKFLLTFL